MEGKLKGLIFGAVALVVAIILFCSSATIVPSGSTGVIVKLGKVSNDTYSEGFHFKTPFITRVVDVSNKVQLLEVEASAVSRDLQTVNSKLAINYRLVAASSASMYQNVGMDYETILIAPAVQESVKASTAKYTAEGLITQRDAVGDEIKVALEAKLNSYGIYIEKFSIINFDFSAEYDKAIEEKQVSEQQKLKAEIDKEKAIIEAEAEAETKRVQAQGKADATLIEANATAEANKAISESIDNNVLMYMQLDKWSGQLPQVTGGDNGFIYQVGPIGQSNSTTNTTKADTTEEVVE